jgi:hypothetical protein
LSHWRFKSPFVFFSLARKISSAIKSDAKTIELIEVWTFRIHRRLSAERESSYLAPTIFAFVDFFFNGVAPKIEYFDYYRI